MKLPTRQRTVPRGGVWGLCLAVGVLALPVLIGCERSPATEGSAPREVASLRRASDPAPQGFNFVDVTSTSGVRFRQRDGHDLDYCAMVESLGAGVAMLDYDGDGWLDLFYPGGGTIDEQREFRGLPNGLFRAVAPLEFVDVSVPSGAAGPARYFSHGCSTGDFDHDGFMDVLVTGFGGVQLLRNAGDGTFDEVGQVAGLTDAQWSSSAAWGDLNGDGLLDLYVAHYLDWSWENHPFCNGDELDEREVCGPKLFGGLTDTLYYNQGDGTFRDVSSEVGLCVEGKGLGVLLADFDLDNDLDIYVANDTVANFMYLNGPLGRFSEEGVARGAALGDTGTPNGSMGIDLCDFNADGWPDIWVTNFLHESMSLYRNQGDAQFVNVSKSTGVKALNGHFVAWGAAFRDFDRDGDEDVVFINGGVSYFTSISPSPQLPVLLENLAPREVYHRREFPDGSFFATPRRGRGLACGDLDQDGDLDLAVTELDGPAVVLDNRGEPQGGYLRVRLIGTDSNRDAVGARVTLHTSRGDQGRQVIGGGSYCSQSDRSLFWGVPNDTTLEYLTIKWPSGLKHVIQAPPLNETLTLIEPRVDRSIDNPSAPH